MIRTILVYIIKTYKLILSPIIGPSCRYLPTCSEYFIDCLNEYGVINGTIKGTKLGSDEAVFKIPVRMIAVIRLWLLRQHRPVTDCKRPNQHPIHRVIESEHRSVERLKRICSGLRDSNARGRKRVRPAAPVGGL
mgnify:CR=1 FL=1